MKPAILSCALLVSLGFVADASAKGCLKGAAVGAVGGHVAGHQAILGAAAGCAIGHHMANKPLAQAPTPKVVTSSTPALPLAAPKP